MARKLYGLFGDEQQEFLQTLSWAEEHNETRKYLLLFSRGEINREQILQAFNGIKENY